eukprot:COSAG01_NODE_25906_length_729_cov_7.609524_1_plen_198_part_10
MGRRAKQAAAVAKKADAEDQYFRECQQLVRATQPPTDGRTKQCATGSAYAPSVLLPPAQARRSGEQRVNRDQRERELFQKQGAAGINFETYDKIDVEVSGSQAGAAPALAHFQDLGGRLPPFLVRNIGLMNYTRPTPIQKHSIPLGLAGCDLMCCAQTGSGKTAAFLLPICAALGAKGSSAQAGARQAAPSCVVMAPT